MQAYANLSLDSIKGDELHIFLTGCDFNCQYCNVPNILKFSEEFLVDIKNIKKFIDDNSIGMKSVVFTGGEPGLQRQALLNLARFVKKNGLRVVLDTNGSKPDTLKSLLLSELLDEVRLDIKSPFDDNKFEKITRSKTFFITTDSILDNIKETIKILGEYQKKIDIKIFTTIVPTLVFKKEDIFEIANKIKDLRCTYILRKYDDRNSNLRDISSTSTQFLNSLKEMIEKKYRQLNVEIIE